jgi:hypothetical protein
MISREQPATEKRTTEELADVDFYSVRILFGCLREHA